MTTSWMTPNQRWQWQLLLELKLRRLHGDAFQGFFASVMEHLHGNDFVRVRAFGSLGDKGCDGYLQGAGRLYQCYGKLHDAALNVTTLVGKIETDYTKAAAALARLIREWHFVHNLFDGMPVEALAKLDEMRAANPHHVIGFVGPAGFEERVFALEELRIVALLGPVASAEDSCNLRMEEVRDLMNGVTRGMVAAPIDEGSPAEVPYDKLDFNGITGPWHHLLASGSRNAAFVAEYVSQHADPEFGRKVAEAFRERYRDLKAQGLLPNAILTHLYEGVTGIGSVSPERQVAAQALLAYLFDACDIFEDHPSKVAA